MQFNCIKCNAKIEYFFTGNEKDGLLCIDCSCDKFAGLNGQRTLNESLEN